MHHKFADGRIPALSGGSYSFAFFCGATQENLCFGFEGRNQALRGIAVQTCQPIELRKNELLEPDRANEDMQHITADRAALTVCAGANHLRVLFRAADEKCRAIRHPTWISNDIHNCNNNRIRVRCRCGMFHNDSCIGRRDSAYAIRAHAAVRLSRLPFPNRDLSRHVRKEPGRNRR